MNYSDKLRDPRWQKKRLEVFQRDRFACRYCGATENTLNVHHLTYGPDPWDTPIEDLLTVCDDCHTAEHAHRKVIEKTLLEELKRKGFSYGGVLSLATGIHYMDPLFANDQFANALEWAFRNRDALAWINDRFSEYRGTQETQVDDLPY